MTEYPDTQLTSTWYFARPDLAAHYLDQLAAGDEGRLALFGPRRTGKTSLVLEEIVPLALKRGWSTVYADCWQQRKEPMESLNYALQKAIDQIDVPQGALRRRLKTEVKKIGAAGFSIEFGNEPKGKMPDSPYLQFDWLLATLVARARKPILLVVDEFQAIAAHTDANAIASAIRTALTNARHAVRVLFTGSSEIQLTRLFALTRAPLYEFAARVPYQKLDADFVEFVAQRFREATRRRLDSEQALFLLRQLGSQPQAFLSVVQLPLAQPQASLEEGVQRLLSAQSNNPWAQYWKDCTALQCAVMLATFEDNLQLSSERGLAHVAGLLSKKRVASSSVRRAIQGLQTRGLIEQAAISTARSAYEVTDPVFRLWLQINRVQLCLELKQE